MKCLFVVLWLHKRRMGGLQDLPFSSSSIGEVYLVINQPLFVVIECKCYTYCKKNIEKLKRQMKVLLPLNERNHVIELGLNEWDLKKKNEKTPEYLMFLPHGNVSLQFLLFDGVLLCLHVSVISSILIAGGLGTVKPRGG